MADDARGDEAEQQQGGPATRKPDPTRADTGQVDTGQADTARADTGQADTGQAETGRAGNDRSLRGRDGPDDNGGIGRTLATTLGAASLVGGLTWILLNLHGPEPVVDLAVGVVLALGGLVLLMPHRIHLPGRRTALVAATAGIAGTAAGLAAKIAHVCCMYAYVVERGFPFRWLSRGGVADDPEVAKRLAATDGWHVDVVSLGVNVFVWAYAGILILVVARSVRRGR